MIHRDLESERHRRLHIQRAWLTDILAPVVVIERTGEVLGIEDVLHAYRHVQVRQLRAEIIGGAAAEQHVAGDIASAAVGAFSPGVGVVGKLRGKRAATKGPTDSIALADAMLEEEFLENERAALNG